MRLDLTMLRTRVARRMLALFLVSAVVPIVVFALVSYRLGATRLEQDARTELRRQSKADGQVLLERIRTMARELAFGRGADMIRDPGFAPAPGESTAPERTRFEATALQVDSKVPASVSFFPPLDNHQSEHLRKGLTLLVTGNEAGRRWVALVTPLGEPGSDFPRLWGVLDPLHLVTDPSGAEEDSEFEPGTCLLDGAGAIIHCPDTEVAAKLQALASNGTTSALWQGQAEAKLTGQSPIFLAYDFAAPAWNLSLTRPAAMVLAPLAGYRRLFLLGVVLAVLLVFVVSHVQIRRSMTPLADLEAATLRLRAGDFATRVSVTSTDEFKSLADSFNGMAADLEHQIATLQLMHAVDQAALSERTVPAVAAAILGPMPALMSAQHVELWVSDSDESSGWDLFVATPDGVRHDASRRAVDQSDLTAFLRARDYLVVLPGEPRSFVAPEASGLRHIIFPVVTAERVSAFVVVGQQIGAAERNLTTIGRQLTDQLALGLSNVTLVTELDALSLGALTALARTIDAASPWTAGHSERVTQVAVELGSRLGLDPADLVRIQQGGLLHDIGKIGIPQAILDKPAKLTDAEMAVMRTHPVVGAEIIGAIGAFRDLVPLVKYHHELLDGSGYPSRLHGGQIPALVRILTVADVFDALVSERPYRAGLGSSEALRILEDGAGVKFDERVVGALRTLIGENWSPDVPLAKPSDETVYEVVAAGAA